MKASENTPPGLNKRKAEFMTKDLTRSNAVYNMNIKRHPDFPTLMFESLKVMRLVCAV